jgi:tRNA A37 methylthiotransferase MiaB
MKLLPVSLGCDKNLVDSEHMIAHLTAAGYELTDDDNEDLCEDFHSARVIITKKYTDELLKNILLSLQKAFN